MSSSKKYTPKQIEKYRRQKYIGALNKCTKNLYKIFKDKNSSYSLYKRKFEALKEEIDRYSDSYVQSDHIKKIREYIDRLYRATIISPIETKEEFLELKDGELSNLNRLQKIKNRTKYSKDKHKNIDI